MGYFRFVADPSFPALHIRPPRGWMNDPNGLCRVDGRYHVFFQYNPAAPVHSAIHWGHVSSTDLLSWQEHPIALSPRQGLIDAAGCWSGCVIDDSGVPTAVYTANPDHAGNAVAAGHRANSGAGRGPGSVHLQPRRASVRRAGCGTARGEPAVGAVWL